MEQNPEGFSGQFCDVFHHPRPLPKPERLTLDSINSMFVQKQGQLAL